jgi:3-oxoacyl-[acyl-carrier protein] reductase
MRNVLVTGGSRGLGLAISLKLADAGYRVIALARKESRELASAIAASEKAERNALQFVPFDLEDIDAIPRLVAGLRKRAGPIYGLFNNAALGEGGALSQMHIARIERLVRLNTLSPMVLTKYVVRAMMADGGGRIVNVASIVGFTGYSGLSVYGATKAAMLGFTRSLAREVGRMGVNVNAVAPGFLDTEMTQELDETRREQIARRSALRRLSRTWPSRSSSCSATAPLASPAPCSRSMHRGRAWHGSGEIGGSFACAPTKKPGSREPGGRLDPQRITVAA